MYAPPHETTVNSTSLEAAAGAAGAAVVAAGAAVVAAGAAVVAGVESESPESEHAAPMSASAIRRATALVGCFRIVYLL
ncbi:MAG: hypothetical protein MAG471_00343 [Acidimicrobiaceae bacterium]|nr:hypothetical protein [Acidimicrobiaceae bacterium]